MEVPIVKPLVDVSPPRGYPLVGLSVPVLSGRQRTGVVLRVSGRSCTPIPTTRAAIEKMGVIMNCKSWGTMP